MTNGSPGRKLPHEVTSQITAMLREGVPIDAIARRLGVSKSLVRQFSPKIERTDVELYDWLWPHGEPNAERRHSSQQGQERKQENGHSPYDR